MTKFRLFLLVTLCGIIVAPSLYDALIEKLTEPQGEVCVEGHTCEQTANTSQTASSGIAGERTAEDIYQIGCHSCHTAGVAGAPKIGFKSDWEARLSSGVQGLVKNAYNGYGAMPAKGLCLDCSEEEIEQAVRYMLSESGIDL